MSFVIDNSITLAWCFENEHAPAVMELLELIAETSAIAPSLWPLEALNGLLMAERRKRLDRERQQRLTKFLRELPVIKMMKPLIRHKRRVWLAERYRLTLYDAAYLELVQPGMLPLATLDQGLIRAGKALGIILLGR